MFCSVPAERGEIEPLLFWIYDYSVTPSWKRTGTEKAWHSSWDRECASQLPATSIPKETWHARLFEIKYSRDSMQTVKREKLRKIIMRFARPANDISLLGKNLYYWHGFWWVLALVENAGWEIDINNTNLHLTCCCLIISDQWLLSVRTLGGNLNLKSVYEVLYILHVLSSCKKIVQTPPTTLFCTLVEKSTLLWRPIRWCRQLRRKKREGLLRGRHSSILQSLPNCHSHGRVDLQDSLSTI